MKRLLLVILVLVCSFEAFASEPKPLISVFDFKGTNISDQELMLFVDFYHIRDSCY